MLAALALLASAGCGSPAATDDGSLTLIVTAQDGSNPLADPNASTLYVEIDDSNHSALMSQSFALGGPIELDHVPMGKSRYVVLETQEPGGATLMTGTAGPVDLNAGEHNVVTVVMQ